MIVRLGLISARYPYDAHEPYLDAELHALARQLGSVTVIPTSPRSAEPSYADVPAGVVRIRLWGGETLALAMRTFTRRPRRTIAAVAVLLREGASWRVRLKNLAVLPKGLAVAELARRRRLDHVHAYWLSTPATVAWLVSRIAGIPYSATAHAWDIYENNLAARKVRDAAFVRTISERGRRDLLALTGADPARVHVVRLGVDLGTHRVVPATRRSERAHETSPEPLRILCAAAFVPKKGHAVLLRALALLRDRDVAFVCTLAGDGPLRNEIVARIDALRLRAHVSVVGTVPHAELLMRLARGDYDVSVLASLDLGRGMMEGVPVALTEAMAAGTVVVATNTGSISELVDVTTGVLVPHLNGSALADALAAVAADPALRERLREAARRRVEREFDVIRTTSLLHALISGAGERESPVDLIREGGYAKGVPARGGARR